MNWQEHVNLLIEKEQFCEAAEYLEQEIANNPDDMYLYIETIYIMMEIKGYHNCAKGEYNFESDSQKIKEYFEMSYPKYEDNHEYLFFIGFIMTWMEWFFGQSDTKLAYEMMNNAALREPDNLLYQWISSNDEKKNPTIFGKLINTQPEKLEWLRTKGFAGKYILGIIDYELERLNDIPLIQRKNIWSYLIKISRK